MSLWRKKQKRQQERAMTGLWMFFGAWLAVAESQLTIEARLVVEAARSKLAVTDISTTPYAQFCPQRNALEEASQWN